jgi:large subunit ribosomal protein L22
MATAKQVRVSPQKVGLVMDLIRGKKVDEALAILRFTPTPTAWAVAKVVKSAAANAENNFQMAPSNLRVAKVYADKGPSLKRARPKARGRVNPILKRSTHITVVVAEE